LKYNRIEELRESLRYSKKDIYDCLGITAAGYEKMIKNKTCTVSYLEKIAELFQVPITIFFETDHTDHAFVSERKGNYELKNLELEKCMAQIELLKEMLIEKDKLISELNRTVGRLLAGK